MDITSLRDLQVLVRARRRELGLNQEEVADRAGVSRRWLSGFERGSASSEIGLVLRLLAALGLLLEVSTDATAQSAAATATHGTTGDAISDEGAVDLVAHLASFASTSGLKRT